MLRIHLVEIQPWIDSKGNVRSRFEEFPLLTRSGIERLEWDATLFTVWRIVVVTDRTGSGGPFKPIRVQSDTAKSTRLCERLGSDAPELNPSFRGLLRDLFIWICGHSHDGWQWCFEDRFWVPGVDPKAPPQRRLLNFAAAVNTGLTPSLNLDHTWEGKKGTLWALASPSQVSSVLADWWPSNLGVFAGMARAPGIANEATRILEAGAIEASDIDGLEMLLTTSRPFDNQGWDVMVRGKSWVSVRQELEAIGLRDGMALNDVPSRRLIY